MSPDRPRRRNLESLRKEAKRWLAALRAGSLDARARLERALPDAPANPTLRDVQLALAREHGFPGWAELKRAATLPDDAGAPTLARYEEMAEALLDAYRTGTPEAMERHYRFTWHRRAWRSMRAYVQLDLGKRPNGPDDEVDISLDEARWLVAVEHGFADWEALRAFTASVPRSASLAAKPVRLTRVPASEDSPDVATTRDWNEVFALLTAHPDACLRAEGQMTDAALTLLASATEVTALDLAASHGLTDHGLRQLARMPRLKHLNLSGTAISDGGLSVLRELRSLESVSLAWTRITDDGAAELAHCGELERVDLMGTRTGDGALRALAGKRRLRELATGTLLSDAGMPLLHELPMFAAPHAGEAQLSLLGPHVLPNRLTLRGAVTDRGMAAMRGLDGLFALDIDDPSLPITAAAIAPLLSLPNLGFLSVDATDDRMPVIAEMPRLRYLAAQDTTAGDEGFRALSRSQSLEYLWGRRCHNLHREGFIALAGVPRLRGLSVSCLHVDDAGVAALPDFPALEELMPMDVPDASYRHVGRCTRLHSLILMYCRDTTDAATEHITALPALRYYFNSYTEITDRTPALLSTMESLERITFDACHRLTNAGVARLAPLPRLRELRVSGRGLTPDLVSAFPARIQVRRQAGPDPYP